MKKIFLILTLVSQIALAKADLLFEGYSKILSGKNQVGYIVNRYEFDNSQKQFISTTFLKTNEFGGNLTESLKAYATEDLKPVSYQYTTIVGAETKTIDAKFNNGKMTATIFDGKKTSKVNKPLPNGAFLSTFLAYVMLKSPQGFKADTKYDYQAVAEEDAAIYTGHAIVKQQEDYMGFKLFHVENEFKGSKFISYVSERGEMFSTNSPVQNISTELVAHAADATNNFKVPTSIVKSLFGSIPLGTKNEVSAKADKTSDKKSPEKKIGLTVKHIVGQHVLIGISGHSLTQEEKSFIVENNIGGVVLFSRNVKEPKQIHDLCSEIQSLAQLTPEKTPLYIGIDMEGGRVARLKKPFTEWPPLKKLGDLDSPTMSFNLAQAMGAELHAVGINLDFAPCIDTFTNAKNTVIGDRAVSVDPQMVAKHASALIRGYLKADVMPCAKHFPGHGHTIIDSHEDLPEEEADLQRLNEVELVPFKKSFKSKIEMIMTAHIRFKNVDPEWPVTLSEIFLKQILRDQLGYQGLVITDDLDMKAMAKHYEKNFIPVKSLQAGANLLLYCNEPESPPIAIEAIFAALASKQLDKAHLENNYKTLLQVKKDNASCFKIPSWSESQKQIGLGSHQDISKAIAEGRILENLMA